MDGKSKATLLKTRRIIITDGLQPTPPQTPGGSSRFVSPRHGANPSKGPPACLAAVLEKIAISEKEYGIDSSSIGHIQNKKLNKKIMESCGSLYLSGVYHFENV